MKNNIKNSIVAFIVLAAFSIALVSCNRGMGCPNNFSLDLGISKMIHTVDTPTID